MKTFYGTWWRLKLRQIIPVHAGSLKLCVLVIQELFYIWGKYYQITPKEFSINSQTKQFVWNYCLSRIRHLNVLLWHFDTRLTHVVDSTVCIVQYTPTRLYLNLPQSIVRAFLTSPFAFLVTTTAIYAYRNQ